MTFIREVLLSSRCVDCGNADLLVLDFDHIGPKRGTVVTMARRGCSLETLKDEVSRCEVRCANCHRRRTRSAERAAQQT